MLAKFKTKDLKRAVGDLNFIAGGSNDLVLSNILMEFSPESQKAEFTCRDERIQSSIEIRGVEITKAEKEIAACCVKCKKFASLVSMLDIDEITLKVEPKGLQVSTKNGKYNFETINPDDFSKIKFPEEISSNSIGLCINSEIFSKQLKFASYSSKSSDKDVLQSMKVDILTDTSKILCSSTDSYRFTCVSSDIVSFKIGNPEAPKTYLISNKPIEYLLKSISQQEEEKPVTLWFEEDRILRTSFEYPEFNMTKKVILNLLDSTKYPDMVKIIAQKCKNESNKFKSKYELNLAKKPLMDALSRMLLMSSSINQQVILSYASPGEFKVIVEKQEFLNIEGSEEEIEPVIIGKHPTEEEMGIRVGLNCSFLLEALKYFDSDSVNFILNGSMDPVVIYDEDPDKKYILIMPQQI